MVYCPKIIYFDFNSGWNITPGARLTMKNLISFIVGIFLIKWFWGWTVPDLFPNGVKFGMVVASISWFSAFKLSVFFTLLASVPKISKIKRSLP